MTLWIVWRTGMYHGCWECEGGGDAELWQVYAETANQALNLVRDALQLSPWDSPAELHCLAVSPSRARKARIIPQSQWFADQSAFVDPPPPNFETPEKIADQLDEFFRAAAEHLGEAT